MNTPLSKPAIDLDFEQSKSQPVAIVAEKDWWDRNQYRVAGLLRTITGASTIASGLGIAGAKVGAKKSNWRVGYGSVSLLASAYMAAFGEKGGAEKGSGAENTGRNYYGMIALSGAMAVASGMSLKPKRMAETLSGLWMAAWSAYAALAPEKEAPTFDGPTQSKAAGFSDKEAHRSLLDQYHKNPKKFAADMLQFAALFALNDGIQNKDPMRIISGVSLASANFLQRNMRDADFVAQNNAVSR